MNYPTPLIVDANGDSAPVALTRLPFKQKGDGGYNEAWVQKLVASHSSVLPIQDIEAAFTPAISVCIELPLASGFLDNLLVTPHGQIIAVECKLWRNSEARREVVAQIIDYAKDLQRLSYTELQSAARQARRDPQFQLYDLVTQAVGEAELPLDELRFVDAVSRNLRQGRCLLLIVGDGLTEGAEAMTEFLQQHAGMHFALALVQLAVHEVPGTSQRLVVPSIPLRTTNIVRGIVQIEGGSITVSAPATAAIAERATTLSEDEFFAALDAIEAGTSRRLREFLAEQEDLHVGYDVGKTLRVRMVVGDDKMRPFVINVDGTVDTSYDTGRKELQRPFAERLAAAIPGATAKETPTTWCVPRRKMNGAALTVWDLLTNSDGVRAALAVLNKHMVNASSP
jgi:hypothetical protein